MARGGERVGRAGLKGALTVNTPVKLLPGAKHCAERLLTWLSVPVTPGAGHCHSAGGETEAETLGSSRRVTPLASDGARCRLTHRSVVLRCVLNDRRGQVLCTRPLTEWRVLAGSGPSWGLGSRACGEAEARRTSGALAASPPGSGRPSTVWKIPLCICTASLKTSKIFLLRRVWGQEIKVLLGETHCSPSLLRLK